MRITLTSFVVAALIGVGTAAHGACPANPAGGPNDLLLTSTGSGSDLDLGWKRDYSNIKIPGGSTFHTCLSGCDLSTNPVCDADGAAVTTLGDAFSPPVPIYAGNPATGVCVVVKFTTPPNGTANIQTGEIDMKVGLSAQAYLFAPTDNICPRCSGATIGASGTCDGGARAGQPCVTDDIAHVIGFTTANPDYPVSRSCLPAGAPTAAISIADIPVTTKTATLNGSRPCAGQAADDDCGTSNNVHRACTSTTCTGAALNKGGVPQFCCAGSTGRPCFPTGADAVGKIERDGTSSPATPQWPDTTYDKAGDATVVSAFCVPTTGSGLIDAGVGVPGPLAMIVPLTHTWSRVEPPTTTTTSTVPTTTSSTIVSATTSTTLAGVTTTTVATPTTTTSTTIPGCTSPADCDDHDACTNDVCSVNVCGHSDVGSIDCATTDLGALQQSDICGAETIDAKLLKKINAAVAKATNFLAKSKAASKPAKGIKLANKASNALKALQKQVAKAVNAKKNPISSACSLAINGVAQRVRNVIADTVSP